MQLIKKWIKKNLTRFEKANIIGMMSILSLFIEFEKNRRIIYYENDIPAKEKVSCKGSRFPCQNEQQGRKKGSFRKESEREKGNLGLIEQYQFIKEKQGFSESLQRTAISGQQVPDPL